MHQIEKYLTSIEAQSDVQKLLTTKPMQSIASTPSNFWWVPRHLDGMIQIELQHVLLDSRPPTTKNMFVYYRPNDKHFIVSDLGDGWKAVRLRGLDWHVQDFAIANAYDKIAIPLMAHEDRFGTNAQWGTIELRCVMPEQLPEKICAVMLASWKVSNLSLDSNSRTS